MNPRLKLKELLPDGELMPTTAPRLIIRGRECWICWSVPVPKEIGETLYEYVEDLPEKTA